MKYIFLFSIVLLVGCTSFPNKQDNTANNPLVIKTPSGKASITLSDDGLIEIRGKKVLIYSEDRLILQGKQLDVNPSVQKRPKKTSKKIDKVLSELQTLPIIGADSALSQDSRITYSSTASIMKVVEFYRQELNNRGWKTVEIVTDRQPVLNLLSAQIPSYNSEMTFQKGAELVLIQVSKSDDNTRFINILPLGSMNIRKLPRCSSSKIIYETAGYRGEATQDTVEKTTEYLRIVLKKAGWQEEEDKHILEKNLAHMTYIQNNTELSVYILAESDPNNQTLIQFNIQRIAEEGE